MKSREFDVLMDASRFVEDRFNTVVYSSIHEALDDALVTALARYEWASVYDR